MLAGRLYNPFYFCKVGSNVSVLPDSSHFNLFSLCLNRAESLPGFLNFFKDPTFGFAVRLCGFSVCILFF